MSIKLSTEYWQKNMLFASEIFATESKLIMKKWFLGTYIQNVLDEKNWSYKELARKTGLSDSYINHLIHGRRTTNDNPPKISVDTLLLLSNALQVHEMDLILAYKGELKELSGLKNPSFDFDYEFEKYIKKASRDSSQLKDSKRLSTLKPAIAENIRILMPAIIEIQLKQQKN